MAYQFDEVDDYITISDNAALTFPDGDWTVGGWIYFDDLAGGSLYEYPMSWGAYNVTPSIQLVCYEGALPNNCRFIAKDDDGTGFDLLETDFWTVEQQWQLLIMVRSSGTFFAYLDDVQGATKAMTDFNACNVAEAFNLGRRSDGDTNRYFGGRLAEWAKWDRALSAGERTAWFRGVSPWAINQTSLQWYLPMHIGGTSGLYVDYGPNRLTVNNFTSTDGNHAPVSPLFLRRAASAPLIEVAAGGAVAPTSNLLGPLYGALGGPIA